MSFYLGKKRRFDIRDFAFRKTTINVAKAEPLSVNYNRWLKPNGNGKQIF